MNYLSKSLAKQEELAYASHPHQIIFAPSIIIFIMAVLLWIYLPTYVQDVSLWHGYHFYQIISGAVGLVGAFSLIRAYVYYLTSEYGITNQRVIMKTGLFRVSVVEVFLQRLEGISVQQSFFGQIFNYGTVVITGTGGTADVYTSVPSPIHFRNIVQQQMSQLGR